MSSGPDQIWILVQGEIIVRQWCLTLGVIERKANSIMCILECSSLSQDMQNDLLAADMQSVRRL